MGSSRLSLYMTGLINGRRRFNNSEPLPLTVFNVTKGDRYLFRVVNSGGEYALQLSVDQHRLTVVACNGKDMRPILVDQIVLAPAERVDFELLADQKVGRYWMRSRTLADVMQGGSLGETQRLSTTKGLLQMATLPQVSWHVLQSNGVKYSMLLSNSTLMRIIQSPSTQKMHGTYIQPH